ncbi:MAG: type II toxin-antitoxin system PemK/MazF family toxin [Candidatus Saccharimonas sp.]|nr:type II toxin-antitoxin system PemK/MazF family toxin [Planctomycetaceae bacterium]
MKRGDIVLIDVPFAGRAGRKVRPALVVQSDHYNQTFNNMVVAVITGNTKRMSDPAHLFIDPANHPESGLRVPSLVSCVNLHTVERVNIVKTLGVFPTALFDQLDTCLQAALGIVHS